MWSPEADLDSVPVGVSQTSEHARELSLWVPNVRVRPPQTIYTVEVTLPREKMCWKMQNNEKVSSGVLGRYEAWDKLEQAARLRAEIQETRQK